MTSTASEIFESLGFRKLREHQTCVQWINDDFRMQSQEMYDTEELDLEVPETIRMNIYFTGQVEISITNLDSHCSDVTCDIETLQNLYHAIAMQVDELQRGRQK